MAPNLPEDLERRHRLPGRGRIRDDRGRRRAHDGPHLGSGRSSAPHRRATLSRVSSSPSTPDRTSSRFAAPRSRSVMCRSTASSTAIDRGTWRTGDLASIRPDGALELDGRADALILRGGRNIDPVRIEHALEDHPAVRRAAVFGVPNRAIAGEQDIWAVVVPDEHGRRKRTARALQSGARRVDDAPAGRGGRRPAAHRPTAQSAAPSFRVSSKPGGRRW